MPDNAPPDEESTGPIRTGSTPALARKYGGYVSPSHAERNAGALDHAEARHRRFVVENARGR